MPVVRYLAVLYIVTSAAQHSARCSSLGLLSPKRRGKDNLKSQCPGVFSISSHHIEDSFFLECVPMENTLGDPAQ